MNAQSNISVPTLEEIAARYHARRSGSGWKIPCPAPSHPGDRNDPNCYIAEGDDGGIVAKCHSHGCEWADIMDGLGLPKHGQGRHYVASYQNVDGRDRHVYRTDGADGKRLWGKGSPKGCLLLTWGDDMPGDLLVIVEGEKAATALFAHGIGNITPVSWRGGTSAAEHAEVGIVEGRKVLLWPDDDPQGRAAMEVIAGKVWEAGAEAVKLVQTDGDTGRDAADYSQENTRRLLADATALEKPAPTDSPPAQHGGARAGAGRPKTDDPSAKTVANRKSQIRTEMINWAFAMDLPSICLFDFPIEQDCDRLIEYMRPYLLNVGGVVHIANGAVWRPLSRRDALGMTALTQLINLSREFATGTLPQNRPSAYDAMLTGAKMHYRHCVDVAETLHTRTDQLPSISASQFNDRLRNPFVPFTDGTALNLRTGETLTQSAALAGYLRDADWQIPPLEFVDVHSQALDILCQHYGEEVLDRLAVHWLGIAKATDTLRMPSDGGKTTLYDMLKEAFTGCYAKHNAREVSKQSDSRFTPLGSDLATKITVFVDETTHSDAPLPASVLNAWDSEHQKHEEKFSERIEIRRTASVLLMAAEQWPGVDSDAQGFEARFKWAADRIDAGKMDISERGTLLSPAAVKWFRSHVLNRAVDLMLEHGSGALARRAQEQTDFATSSIATLKAATQNPVLTVLRENFRLMDVPGAFVEVDTVIETVREELGGKQAPARNKITAMMREALTDPAITLKRQGNGDRLWGYRGISQIDADLDSQVKDT